MTRLVARSPGALGRRSMCRFLLCAPGCSRLARFSRAASLPRLLGPPRVARPSGPAHPLCQPHVNRVALRSGEGLPARCAGACSTPRASPVVEHHPGDRQLALAVAVLPRTWWMQRGPVIVVDATWAGYHSSVTDAEAPSCCLAAVHVTALQTCECWRVSENGDTGSMTDSCPHETNGVCVRECTPMSSP